MARIEQKSVFVVDNYDSFTFNLVESFRQLGVKHIRVCKHDRIRLADLASEDKIVFSPGPALPKDSPIMFQILDAYAQSKSILGVCLGHQAIGEWCGGRLQNHEQLFHGYRTAIEITDPGEPLFLGIPNHFQVGLYHSWSVIPASLPEECLQTAQADGINMALRIKGTRVCGVQFHPESYMTEYGLVLLENWLNES